MLYRASGIDKSLNYIDLNLKQIFVLFSSIASRHRRTWEWQVTCIIVIRLVRDGISGFIGRACCFPLIPFLNIGFWDAVRYNRASSFSSINMD